MNAFRIIATLFRCIPRVSQYYNQYLYSELERIIIQIEKGGISTSKRDKLALEFWHSTQL